MNLSMLDREQLEDILLNPPRVEVNPLQCSDSITLDCLPTGPAERPTRIRHVLAAAHELLVRSANTALAGRCVLDSPTLVTNYFTVHFAGAERETFVVVFLDAQMRVIATEELFAGTLQQTSVYPREVVKRALHHNAGGVIFGHPHPSGQCEPSSGGSSTSHKQRTSGIRVQFCPLPADRLVKTSLQAGSRAPG